MTLTREMTGRTAALTALAAAVLAAALVTVLIVAAVYSGLREEAAENLRQLAIYRGEIDSRAQVENAYAQLKARIASMPGLVNAASGAPAAAQVQEAVKQVVEASGGEVRSAQVLPASNANGFEVVSIEADLVVPASRLKDLLYAVETHRPYLFIDNADITAPISWDPKSNIEPSYEVRWGLKSYRWVGGR